MRPLRARRSSVARLRGVNDVSACERRDVRERARDVEWREDEIVFQGGAECEQLRIGRVRKAAAPLQRASPSRLSRDASRALARERLERQSLQRDKSARRLMIERVAAAVGRETLAVERERRAQRR